MRVCTSKLDVPKVHDQSHNAPDVPHISVGEVEHLHGSSDHGKVLRVSDHPTITVVGHVTFHTVALATEYAHHLKRADHLEKDSITTKVHLTRSTLI